MIDSTLAANGISSTHRFRLLMLLLLVANATIGLVCSKTIRADENGDGLSSLIQLLGQVEDDAFRLDLLNGIGDSLEGRKRADKPKGWDRVYKSLSKSKSQAVRRRSDELALVFADQAAVARLTKLADDVKQTEESRIWAATTLATHAAAGLEKAYTRWLDDPLLRLQAIRGLSANANASTVSRLLEGYPDWSVPCQQATIALLANRLDSAQQLVQAMQSGRVPPADVSSFHVRRIRALGDKKLTEKIAQVWGQLRPASKELAEQIATWKKRLPDKKLAKADLSVGAKLFKSNCGSCHRLRGEGGRIGPDLTGSNRDNLHYLLENILDPSAAVAKDYRLSNVITEDGRVLAGIARRRPNWVLQLITPEREILLDDEDVASIHTHPISMMPTGILAKLTQEQVRDLIAFLRKK